MTILLEFLLFPTRSSNLVKLYSYVRVAKFHYFSDPHEDEKITAEGMMRFLEDMNLDPESRVVLILAWKFKAATQCEFSREEFVNGMSDLG